MATEKVLPVEEHLKIREELISVHSLNPFLAHASSPRLCMMASHLSQLITLNNGDERIIQTGVDDQLGGNTFSKKIDNDSRVIDIVTRYNGISVNSVNAKTEIVIIYEDLVTGELDSLEVPNYFSLHQYFGFEYKWNEEQLSSLTKGSIIPKGTIIADSPSVTDNSGYKFGLNANVALMTIPEVGEDGVVISKSMAERLEYTIFERRVVEYGTDNFPLNMYGDENVYKPFPEIGEKINEDSIVMALRDYDQELATALVSKKDVLDFDPLFDKAEYVKSPDMEMCDIKVIHSPKFKKEVYNGTSEVVDKYVRGLREFHKHIIDTYESLEKDHYKRFRTQLKVSDRFNKLLLDSYAIVNPDDKRIKKTYKNEDLDLYRVEMVIKKKVKPKVGGKITDLHGIGGAKITELHA